MDNFVITDKIKEFENDTHEAYKNSNIRQLNSIQFADFQEEEFQSTKRVIFDDKNKGNIQYHNEEFMTALATNLPVVRKLVGFYNTKKKYDSYENCGKSNHDDCGLDVGTVVNHDNMSRIFKNPVSTRKDVFDATIGYGKKNLHDAVQKLQKQGVKYIFLEAGGDKSLVELYKKYGFNVMLDSYIISILDTEIQSTTPIMVGLVDDIVLKT